MKKFQFINIINTAAAVETVRALEGVINDIRMDGDSAEQWQRMVEYGEYPARTMVNGKLTDVIQVIDRQAGQLMVENHATVINQIRHLGRGLPIFVGHPDDREWLKSNPGADESAKGRIKQLDAREDGVWMLTAVNDDGRKLIGGDAPPFSAQSPNWDMLPVSPGSKRYRPYLLRSIGLTNRPNISSCVIGLNTAGANDSPSDAAPAAGETENNTTMNPKLLKRLGLAPEATPEQIEAAVATALNTLDTTQEAVTAANTRATTAETELGTLRDSLVTSAVNTAVQSGRITDAQKPQWTNILKVDFVNGSAALDALGPVTALNTTNHVADLSQRRTEAPSMATSVSAINEAVADYAKANNLDIKNNAEYDRAFAAVKQAKPELF